MSKNSTNKDTIKFRHEQVDKYKLSTGCCICGYNKHPSALCFDHLPEHDKSELTKNGCSKRTCAGGMYRLYHKTISTTELIDEIKKCRVMCCNCHMEVTHNKNKRSVNKNDKLDIDNLERILKEFENE